MLRSGPMHEIYIDADGCPVKDEVYRVARRHGWKVYVVSNSRMFVPMDEKIQQVVVGGASTRRTTGSPSGSAAGMSRSPPTSRSPAAVSKRAPG